MVAAVADELDIFWLVALAVFRKWGVMSCISGGDVPWPGVPIPLASLPTIR